MRVSIVAPDDTVVINGVASILDCKELRAQGIHAIQWYEDHGEVEFERHAKPNEIMHDLEMIETLVGMAKPIPSPKPPTPEELTEIHNRLALEYPDWRKAWDERDAEMKRLFHRALQEPPMPTPPKETATKPKKK
jgi:hypothetical protein